MYKSESWGSYTEWEPTGSKPGGGNTEGRFAAQFAADHDPFLPDHSPASPRAGIRNVVYAANIRPSEVAAMTGVNGSGPLNGSTSPAGSSSNGSTSATDRGCWTVGLINSKFRYLSAETFGFRVNANGKSLKKKQVWILEPSGDGESVVLRSHLNKYIAVDQFGNVTCDQEEKDETSKFEISVCDDFSGRWAFRSLSRGYFLGATGDALACAAKAPADAELWHVHLAARPQVNLRSVGRKRFAHLAAPADKDGGAEGAPEQGEIRVEECVPWGEDTLFTLEFREEAPCKYAIHACNNTYLQVDGRLVPQVNKDCYFAIEYHGGYIALRDGKGNYLAPIGSRAVLKTRSSSVTKDELFSLEDSLPQASFVAAANDRYISVKQGVDVTANQDEISDHETFQLEFEGETRRWYVRTMQDKYFTLQAGGGVQANENKRSSNALFDLRWHEDGSVSFRANNGKLLGTKRSGHLFANCEDSNNADEENKTRFYFYLVNRPVLVLKCEQGFVGSGGKGTSGGRLECNRANYETIQVERADKGAVYFMGQSGKYLQLGEGGLTVSAEAPQPFYLELHDPTRMRIKTSGGRYVCAEKNGGIGAGTTDQAAATLWEY